jgi:hypothetical protein
MDVYCDSTIKRINKLCGQNVQLLCGFVKLRKAAISFVASVCRSLCPSAWNNPASYRKYFHEISYLGIFRKRVEKIQVSLNSNDNKGTSHEDLCTLLVYLAEFETSI